MWTIELWHASGRNMGSTGENPVGEGKGAFSCACNTLVPSRPRSFPFQPLPPIPRSRFLFRSGRGVEKEKEREEERKKESPNSKYDDYLQKSAFDEYTERHTLCNRA